MKKRCARCSKWKSENKYYRDGEGVFYKTCISCLAMDRIRKSKLRYESKKKAEEEKLPKGYQNVREGAFMAYYNTVKIDLAFKNMSPGQFKKKTK